MIKLKNNKNLIILVDPDISPILLEKTWSIKKCHNTLYAYCAILKKKFYLHRLIMNPRPDEYIDHINGDGLDNRKCNLRICTNSQNNANKGKQKNNKSGYKGVSWDKTRNKWKADIMVNKKTIYLGRFNVINDAARAYNNAAVKYFGEFARLNDV